MHSHASTRRWLVLGVTIGLWFACGWLAAREKRPDETPFPAEHIGKDGVTANPDRAASDLTESVARELPRLASSGAELVRRNLIDRQLFGSMERDEIPHAPLSNDYEFVRRAYLDLTGRIPTLEQYSSFVGDKSQDKRDRLIDELLAMVWRSISQLREPDWQCLDEAFRRMAEKMPAGGPSLRRNGCRNADCLSAEYRLAARLGAGRLSRPTPIDTKTLRTKSSFRRPAFSWASIINAFRATAAPVSWKR
jgi:hypothetical protein